MTTMTMTMMIHLLLTLWKKATKRVVKVPPVAQGKRNEELCDNNHQSFCSLNIKLVGNIHDLMIDSR